MKKNGKDNKNTNYNCHDDVCDVVGIKTCDTVLQYGGNIFPFMHKHVHSMHNIECEQEIETVRRQVFDKILVDADGMDITKDVVRQLADMNCGLMVFFTNNKDFCHIMRDHFLTSYYPADAWVSMSSVGGCVITNAKGAPMVHHQPATTTDIEQLKEKFNG